MVKVLTAQQIREADLYTIKQEPISSLDLMERAATQALELLIDQLGKEHHFSIFCGVGNNGGDGLVMARLMAEQGIASEVFVVEFSKNYSADFQENLKRLPYEPKVLTADSFAFEVPQESILIDALFGTGLSREAEGLAAKVIDRINEFVNYKVAIDLPSGLYAEENENLQKKSIVKADHTLTFQFPKLCMFFPECAEYVGTWEIVNIHLHATYIEEVETNYVYFTHKDAQQIHRKRKLFTHKGEQGRAFLIVGSKGKMGAAILASRGCLRAGVGLLTLQVPGIGYSILQSQVPEAMVECDVENDYNSELKGTIQFDALGIGPGIGQAEKTQNLLKLLIQQSTAPMVLDADALNILSENKTWLSFLPKGSILTPHPTEFKRLAGGWTSDFNRLAVQREFSIKFGVYVILKGRHSSISCPDGQVYFNSTGNPGMATGGSGDVLTGIITSLLAQGYAPEQSALFGVYLHGLAGDIAADRLSEESMIAGDLVDFLPMAFNQIRE